MFNEIVLDIGDRAYADQRKLLSKSQLLLLTIQYTESHNGWYSIKQRNQTKHIWKTIYKHTQSYMLELLCIYTLSPSYGLYTHSILKYKLSWNKRSLMMVKVRNYSRWTNVYKIKRELLKAVVVSLSFHHETLGIKARWELHIWIFHIYIYI